MKMEKCHGIYLLFAKGGGATAAELVANGGEVYFMLNGVHGFLLQKTDKNYNKNEREIFLYKQIFSNIGQIFFRTYNCSCNYSLIIELLMYLFVQYLFVILAKLCHFVIVRKGRGGFVVLLSEGEF